MNRLEYLRKEKGLFQKDIAEYLNCSIAIISMYEKEQRVMDVNVANKLSDYFNVSIDYFLGKSDVRTPIDINEVKFANAGGLNVQDLDINEIEEIRKQVEYMRWKKSQENKDGK